MADKSCSKFHLSENEELDCCSKEVEINSAAKSEPLSQVGISLEWSMNIVIAKWFAQIASQVLHRTNQVGQCQ